MPIFLMTDRQNYRGRGESVSRWQRLKWWFAMTFGFPLVIEEDPTGNRVRISGRKIYHYVAVSRAEIDAAQKAAQDAQAQAQGGKRNIIETPNMVIPRKRPN
jgi:hypothetical protein